MLFNRILKNIVTVDEIEEEKKMAEELIHEKIAEERKKIDTANVLIAQLLEGEHVVPSPNDGSLISMVRTEEAIAILCDALGLSDDNKKATNYPEFFR